MCFGFIDLTYNNLEKEEFFRVEKHEKGIVLEHISYNLGNNPINGNFERFYGRLIRWTVPYGMINDFDLETLTAQEYSEKLDPIINKLLELGYRRIINLYANTVFVDDYMNIDFERTRKELYGTTFRLKKADYDNIATICAELVGQMPARTDEIKKAIDYMRKKENAIVGEQVDETTNLNV